MEALRVSNCSGKKLCMREMEIKGKSNIQILGNYVPEQHQLSPGIDPPYLSNYTGWMNTILPKSVYSFSGLMITE